MPRSPTMSAAINREVLRAELANHPTKEDLASALANHPTKEDLAIWAGALEHRFLGALAAQTADFAHHVSAILAHARGEIAVLDDKYQDLPDRVSRLEATAKP